MEQEEDEKSPGVFKRFYETVPQNQVSLPKYEEDEVLDVIARCYVHPSSK